MSLGIATEALPGETALLASAIEPLEHQPLHGPRKAVQRRAVIGHAEIIEVTPQLAAHRLPKVGEFACVALLAEPAINLHHGAAQSLFRRLALQSRFACPTSAPVVREAE